MGRLNLAPLILLLVAMPLAAQQTGAITGKISGKDGKAIGGVQIEATSPVLPLARHAASSENGEFRVPLLPPGVYTLTFTKAGMLPSRARVNVVLQQNTPVDVVMVKEEVAGARVEVVADAGLVDQTSAALKNSVTAEVIESLPVGTEYRDLMKLIPGVQYTESTVRGPAAGGSGQDNVYQFDGVNVTLPLFGVLSAEPATHDIDQVAIVKGGADATGFNRSAGLTINTISKSGTNTYQGEVSYRAIPANWVASRRTSGAYQYEEDRSYTMANFGGPILKERLFFYTSFYRPTIERKNASNLYGRVPARNFDKTEWFGKLTYAPTQVIFLNASFRTSKSTDNNVGVASSATAATASFGGKSSLWIGILEGNWIINPKSYMNFKYTRFANKTESRPDTIMSVKPALDGSVPLNVNALDQMGQFNVPALRANTPANQAWNTFVSPIIQKYGYLDPATGVMTGGGVVGGFNSGGTTGSGFNAQDFYRNSWQITYDLNFGSGVVHDIHIGYQWFHDAEDLYRASNGWGFITVEYGSNIPAGTPRAGTPYAFKSLVQQQGLLGLPIIHSEYIVSNVEINDKIQWQKFTFNVGFIISNDRLYGQGLRENSSTLSGYELGSQRDRYLMHEIKWKDTFQPRLGVTWNYRGADTIYANYARYTPSANSLPRAASWARNKASQINVYFDAAGAFLASAPEATSQGKLFVPGIKPRQTDEYLIGTTKDFGKGLNGRAWGRYRKSWNFWEDTPNFARVNYNAPDWVPHTLYIPNYVAMLSTLGGGTDGNSVIAALDGSFTKYYEVGLEADWQMEKAWFRGSYVWSHYYGTFDQDNTAGSISGNDMATFIGSSNIADGPGQQIWNNKYGNLAGDRRHMVKLLGFYSLPWSARVGGIAIYQSGQPWETRNYEYYRPLYTGTTETIRFSEPAGSHRTRPHSQLDVNYTQFLDWKKRIHFEFFTEMTNVFNRQTGSAMQANYHSAQYGAPSLYYAPRRLQFGIRMKF